MKKLATAFAAMACIMGSASVFAKAPVISGVPDIVIGDREDGVLTVDNNWFRSVDAINLLDYTVDVDSSDSELLFTFVEGTTAKDLGIRIDAAGATGATVSQLDAVDSATVVADWTGHEITNYADPAHRDYLLTFVDLIRSPEPWGGNPLWTSATSDTVQRYPNPVTNLGAPVSSDTLLDLGWHNTQGSGALQDASRTVWIYVADDPLASGANRVDNDAITVISRNYGFDGLNGGATSRFGSGFANGAGTAGDPASWTYGTISGLTACTSGSGSGTSAGNGYITLASGTATSNAFSRWATQSNVVPAAGAIYTPYVGAIPWVDPSPGGSLVYCARFTMSQNGVDQGAAPQIRLGVYQVNFLQADTVSMKASQGAGAQGNPQIPAQNALHTYKSVWAPNVAAANEADKLLYDPPPAGGPVVDMRTYNAFFDILDTYDNQGGTWTLWNVDVVTSPRPADVAAAVTETNFLAANGWSGGASGTTITAVPSASGIAYTDTGTPRPPAVTTFASHSWSKAINRTVVKWDSNQLLRFKTALSVPNAVDRNGFHWFRLTQATGYFSMGHEWGIYGDDGRLSGTLGGRPFVPPTGSQFVYESYMTSQVDDANFDWSWVRSIQPPTYPVSMDTYTMSLGALALPPSGSTGAELATHFTVHSVAVEALADPF